MKNKANYRIIAVIPARGGSKGVPRKALRTLGDRPLIAYTIRDALEIQGVTKVFVNTDDEEIRDVSLAYGAEVPFLRPVELARDDSIYEVAHRYALEWYRDNEGFLSDIEIVMSPTYPFRRKRIVGQVMEQALADPQVFNIGSIAPARVDVTNFWRQSGDTLKRLTFPIRGPKTPKTVFQSAFSFNIVFNFRSHLPDRRIPFELNEIESIDIDEPRDLDLARQVLKEGLYPFAI